MEYQHDVKDIKGRATFSSAIETSAAYNSWIVSHFRPYIGRTVLEVGIGHGGYGDLLIGVDYVGLDIDEELVVSARARHPRRRYIQGDITSPSLTNELRNLGIDTIFCCNVLEHIADDASAIARMLSLLRVGGHLCLFVPAHPALFTEMDRLAGHYRRYTRTTLRRLIEREGRILLLEYVNPIGGLGWWVNGFLSHSSLESKSLATQIKFFDRYVLPISNAITPLTREFFGQSIRALAVAR